MTPAGMILPATKFYLGNTAADIQQILLTDTLTAAADASPTLPTVDDYVNFANGVTTSNGLPAELVADTSTMTRYMGNIWERRTRFVQLT